MALQEDAASRYLSRKRDKVRERELLQYYNPADHPSNASPTGLVIETGPNLAHSISSPDLTLTALAQLCALRLDTRRCIIRYVSKGSSGLIRSLINWSVLDRDIQYSLAESTRSLDLGCTQKSEAADDGLWIGRARMEKIAGLCEVQLSFSHMGRSSSLTSPVGSQHPSFEARRTDCLHRCARSLERSSVQSHGVRQRAAPLQVLRWNANHHQKQHQHWKSLCDG